MFKRYRDRTRKHVSLRDTRQRLDLNQGNDSDDETGQTMPPGFPDIQGLLKSEKKKVFRDNNHIYFRCEVTMNNVNKLCNLIEEYNREQDDVSRCCTTSIIIPKPIYLHITSLGGDLLAGFMAYDYIKNSKIPVYTIAEGYTVSSGANMFMAGKRRFMTEHSYLLVHQLNMHQDGRETFHAMIDNASNIIEFMTKLYAIYLNNIRYDSNMDEQNILTKEKLEKHMLHDIYWNYDTCHRYGLVDAIYTNYGEHDDTDIHGLVTQDLLATNNQPNKVYRLADLKPSDEVIDRIKKNMQKNNEVFDTIRDIIAKKNANRGNDYINDDYNAYEPVSDTGHDVKQNTEDEKSTHVAKK
jgi:ATP-dependent protease ClpP protease subunit